MRTFIALALFAAISFPASAAEPKVPETNVVFRNATIHDGTGKPPVKGDVHIKGDKIAAVGKVGSRKRSDRDRRDRPHRLPRIHRPAHALRLRAHRQVGAREQELRDSGLHHGRDRQLRLRSG